MRKAGFLGARHRGASGDGASGEVSEQHQGLQLTQPVEPRNHEVAPVATPSVKPCFAVGRRKGWSPGDLFAKTRQARVCAAHQCLGSAHDGRGEAIVGAVAWAAFATAASSCRVQAQNLPLYSDSPGARSMARYPYSA